MAKRRATKQPKKQAVKKPAAKISGYRAIAKCYNVSVKTIQNWIAEGLPHDGPVKSRLVSSGRWDISEAQTPDLIQRSRGGNRKDGSSMHTRESGKRNEAAGTLSLWPTSEELR